MTKQWQIKIGADPLAYPSDLGIEDININYLSLATDTATLTTIPAFDPAYGTIIAIYFNDVRRFLGRVTRSEISETGAGASRTIRINGPWEWLERIPYRQTWRLWRTASQDFGYIEQSRVILNQNSSGQSIDVADQLADIINYAAGRGAPLAYSGAAVTLRLPWDEQRDLRCSHAISRCLRYSPAVNSHINYAADPPTIHFGATYPITLPATAEQHLRGYRDDLVVAGVVIEIERESNIQVNNSTSTYRTLEYLTAGNTNSLNTLHATLQLAGSDTSRSFLRLTVETEDIPTPLTKPAWWIEHHPRLKGIFAFDLNIFQANRHHAKTNDVVIPQDATAFPRISLTPLANLLALNIHARSEIFRATCDITKRDANGLIIEQEHAVELELHVITTDAHPRAYRVKQASSFLSGEPTPTALATQLYSQLSIRYLEGSATFPIASLWPTIGGAISGTPLQSISISGTDKNCTIQFGPPQHLSVNDFASVLQGFRSHRASASWQSRTTAEAPADTETNAEFNGIMRAGGHAPGEKKLLVIGDATGASINLNPASDLVLTETVKARPITWLSPDGKKYSAKALVTAPSDDGSITGSLLPAGTANGQILVWNNTTKVWEVATPVAVTALSDWRLDTDNHKFQIKTRSITAIATDTESAWTTVTEGGTLDQGVIP